MPQRLTARPSPSYAAARLVSILSSVSVACWVTADCSAMVQSRLVYAVPAPAHSPAPDSAPTLALIVCYIRNPNTSQGALVKSWVTPRYRSVVCTLAWPKLSWICSNGALPLCASLANVLRKSCGATVKPSC